MSNEKRQKQWFDYGMFILILFTILTFGGLIFVVHYYEQPVPAEEIAQLSPEIKNKIKQGIKGCKRRDLSLTWNNETENAPYTRRDIHSLKACLQHEAEGKDKISSEMNAHYEQKKALESQINAAK